MQNAPDEFILVPLHAHVYDAMYADFILHEEIY